MSTIKLTPITSFVYDINYAKEDIVTPEQLEAIALANKAIIEYNKRVASINTIYRTTSDLAKERINQIVASVVHSHTLHSEIIDGVTHYWVERTSMIPLKLNESEMKSLYIQETLKTIVYQGFKIVNNVYIKSTKTKGNHIFFINGEPLSHDEVSTILMGDIPQRLLTTKAEF